MHRSDDRQPSWRRSGISAPGSVFAVGGLDAMLEYLFDGIVGEMEGGAAGHLGSMAAGGG